MAISVQLKSGIANCNLKFRRCLLASLFLGEAAPFLSCLFGFIKLEMSGKSQQGHWKSLFHGIMNIYEKSGRMGTLGVLLQIAMESFPSGLGRSTAWKHRGPEMRLEFWLWYLLAAKL